MGMIRKHPPAREDVLLVGFIASITSR